MHWTKTSKLAAVALVAALVMPANIMAQGERPEAEETENRITIKVDNGHWLDVRVYAVIENGRYDRIGTVTSFSSRELELPRSHTQSNILIRLVAVPIGSSQRHASPPIMASVGDVIEWKLTNNLALSNIFVRTI